MKPYLYLTIFLTLIVELKALAQALERDHVLITQEQIKQTSDWLIAKRHQYESSTSDLIKEDLAHIESIGETPLLAFSVIKELIDLAEVREPSPGGTGFFAVRSVSPVVRTLVKIGKPALPNINQALIQKDLPPWSRLALKDALRAINQEKINLDEVMYADNILISQREIREKIFAQPDSKSESMGLLLNLGVLHNVEVDIFPDKQLKPTNRLEGVSNANNASKNKESNANINNASKKKEVEHAGGLWVWLGVVITLSLLALLLIKMNAKANQ